jgi:hypothetical protein
MTYHTIAVCMVTFCGLLPQLHRSLFSVWIHQLKRRHATEDWEIGLGQIRIRRLLLVRMSSGQYMRGATVHSRISFSLKELDVRCCKFLAFAPFDGRLGPLVGTAPVRFGVLLLCNCSQRVYHSNMQTTIPATHADRTRLAARYSRIVGGSVKSKQTHLCHPPVDGRWQFQR